MVFVALNDGGVQVWKAATGADDAENSPSLTLVEELSTGGVGWNSRVCICIIYLLLYYIIFCVYVYAHAFMCVGICVRAPPSPS